MYGPRLPAAAVMPFDRPPKLILLHGFMASPAAWDPVRSELPRTVEAVPLTIPGFRGGEPPPLRYALEQLVETMLPSIRAHQPDFLVGHSMGGLLALAIAARLGASFRGVGAIGLPLFSSPEDGRRFLGQRGPMFRGLLANDLLSHAGCAVAHSSRRAWLPFARWRWPAQPLGVLSQAFAHSKQAHRGALEDVLFGGHLPRLAPQIACPVSLLHGASDAAAPVGRACRMAREHGWEFTELPGTHQLHVERPAVVAAWTMASVVRRSGPVERKVPS